MITLDTTKLDEKIIEIDVSFVQIAGEILYLQKKDEERDEEIRKLKAEISELKSMSLRDSKTLMESIKSLFTSKQSRLKETTIVE